MKFQLNQLSTLSRYGIYGATAAVLCLTAYGVYRYVKREKPAAPEAETKKDANDANPFTETPPAKPAAEAPANSDSGNPAEVERPVHPAEAEDHAGVTDAAPEVLDPTPVESEKTEELRFFDTVHSLGKFTIVQQGCSPFMMKFRSSEPRSTVIDGVPTLIFPIGPGTNVTLAGDKVSFMVEGKRESVTLNLAEQSLPLSISPENQAKSYVFQKGMELLKVREGLIHPQHAYPENFDAERAMATNFQMKNAGPTEQSMAFFNLVFTSATPTTVFPYTRSDMAYIASIVNSAPVEEVIGFSNLEGDRFVHFADPILGDKNMVLVQRTGGYVQVFRGNGNSLASGDSYKNWAKPVGEIFKITDEGHMSLALFISKDAAREVLGVGEVEPAEAQSANVG